MRTKTKFREGNSVSPAGGRINLPGQQELPIEPDSTPTTPEAAPPEIQQAAQNKFEDDAGAALKKQVEELRKSEELAVQRAQQQQQTAGPKPPTHEELREAKLAQWAAGGVSPAELDFLRKNPRL